MHTTALFDHEPPDNESISFGFLRQHISKHDLQHISLAAQNLGISLQQFAVADCWITPAQYTAALARHLNCTTATSRNEGTIGDVLIDAIATSPGEVATAVAVARAQGCKPVLWSGLAHGNINGAEPEAIACVSRAVDELRSNQPTASAGRRMWLWQYLTCGTLVGLAIGCAVAAPHAASIILLCGSAFVFSLVAAFRLLLMVASFNFGQRVWARTAPQLSDRDLPTYAVLVPLFREAAIVPDLVKALEHIDYPHAKLDIALILEEADEATRRAAANTPMPPYMRTIVVPDRQPRTKPKALNMALALTHGEYVTVFDAEDIPAADQLRKAAAAFKAAPGRYDCLQARLAIHNSRQSWISRHFTLEYGTLFHATLPALITIGAPIPLSGTSNHFPRAALKRASWDPFNVTEDADLGIRMTRLGGRIGLIDSDTLEEAPFLFRQWLPQRTRWIKGWMQTYLVHTREPFRLHADLGTWRTIGFHCVFGGYLISALAYPIMLALIATELSGPAPFTTTPGSFHHLALVAAFVDLAAGIIATLVTAYVGIRRAGLGQLASHIWAMPFYWVLISLAAYRAVLQIIWRPHLWEKTEHTARRGRPAKRTNRAKSARTLSA